MQITFIPTGPMQPLAPLFWMSWSEIVQRGQITTGAASPVRIVKEVTTFYPHGTM
jgi:hypothetical protein